MVVCKCLSYVSIQQEIKNYYVYIWTAATILIELNMDDLDFIIFNIKSQICIGSLNLEQVGEVLRAFNKHLS